MPNYRQLALRAARRAGIDPNAFLRQINAESRFQPNAVSPAGARGIAQIMPQTARGWGVNPNDPQAALNAAAQHMAQYQKQSGSLKGALEMYNLGHTAPDSQLPAETRNYIKAVTGGRTPPAGSGLGGRPTVPTKAGGIPQNAQAALALLGFGGSTGGLGGSGDSFDPLTLALQSLSAKEAHPGSQVTPSAAPAPYGGTATTTGAKGVTRFDGKPVAAWIAPILQQARATGIWKGSVNSGERTKAEQLTAAKNFGLQHYPNGPLASNHVYGHGGAVDVSDPQGLKRALAKLGVSKLKSAMADDPVHFSRTGY